MGQNNPIQERMDQLLLKWTIAINTPNIKIVRILSQDDEQDMVETFFEYMLALDTNQEDFVLVLDSPFSSVEDFGKELLEEIEEEIKQWNEAEIPEHIPFENITWKPDYTLGNEANHAQLFIQNMNNFANYLIPKKDIKVSIIIKTLFDKNQAYKWFNDVLQNQMESHLILGVSDTENFAVFDKIAREYLDDFYVIEPELNMDGAMEQLAAMGDPDANETPYRASLVKLMNAVKNRQDSKVQEHAKACLNIATKSLEKDANWLAQIVTIYTILYNDKIGYKKYNDANYFAGKAVEAALLSTKLMDPEVAYRLVGQAHMGRGALYTLKKKRENALEDYAVATESYAHVNDYLMQCESLRLSASIFSKLSRKKEATQNYLKAYHLKDKLTPELIRGSTFPYVIKKLVDDHERYQYLSNEQMDTDLKPVFGDDWREIIDRFGKKPKSFA